MSQVIDIEQKESDVVRLFALNASDEEGRRLMENPNSLARLLGLDAVNTDFLEVFDLKDIASIGLGPYLQDGYGVPQALIDQDAAKLSQLRGHGIVLLSAAITARPTQITIGPELSLIATYPLASTDWRAAPDDTPDSAKPFSAPEAARKKPSDAAMSGRIATLVLVFLALLVLAMVWIA